MVCFRNAAETGLGWLWTINHSKHLTEENQKRKTNKGVVTEMAVLQLSLSAECCNLVTDWAQSAYTHSLHNTRATAGKEAERGLDEEGMEENQSIILFFPSFSQLIGENTARRMHSLSKSFQRCHAGLQSLVVWKQRVKKRLICENTRICTTKRFICSFILWGWEMLSSPAPYARKLLCRRYLRQFDRFLHHQSPSRATRSLVWTAWCRHIPFNGLV